MIFRKILPFALCIILILSTGCSKEPSVHESSSESSSVQIIVTPAEPSESSSSEESSLPSESESSAPSITGSSLPETSSSETEEPSQKDYGTLILVNPWNYIPEDYALELETVQGKYKMDIKAAESARTQTLDSMSVTAQISVDRQAMMQQMMNNGNGEGRFDKSAQVTDSR